MRIELLELAIQLRALDDEEGMADYLKQISAPDRRCGARPHAV
jgi:hypothetical protein